MMRITQKHSRSWSRWLLIITVSSMGIASCGAARLSETQSLQDSGTGASAPEARQTEIRKDTNLTNASGASSGEDLTLAIANPKSRRLPQLIKTAEITMRVDNVNVALKKTRDLLNQQQGDLLRLDSQNSQRASDRETYRLQIRIPQNNFDMTLSALEKLGTVQNRSIQAEDVSDQLVDAQARLKNLRKSEETVLKIMDRSGSIPDVLSASQELSNIREKIERIDAQLQSLQTKALFSHINLNLQSKTGGSTQTIKTGDQLNTTWENSTEAMRNLTLAFLKLGVWGIAFSPYLIALGLLIWLARKSMIRIRHNVKTGVSKSS